MTSIAILQARTNSSRLPGKVLLPINGIPLVVLAAERAANTGRKVIVATSKEKSDDVLAWTLKKHGIPFYRGSLENTLERIVAALSHYKDDALVFRLTADNVFPDGSLLDELESEFLNRNLEYICCNGESSGLPYGMSAELTRLGHLRDALKSTTSSFDQEHVTPYIRRKFGEEYFSKYKNINKGHYRCTIDCLDDYLNVQSIFSSVEDPIKIPWGILIDALDSVEYQPLTKIPIKKLVLGGAQLGLSYGITNRAGQPSKKTAEKILKIAIANGVNYIDTARAYGNSEDIIGEALSSGWQGRAQIITKLSPLVECSTESSKNTVNAFVDSSIFRSLASLRLEALDVLMLHRASHVFQWNGAVWDRLIEHKNENRIHRLGVSVQTPDELESVLDIQDIVFIQMPFNILDWRWDKVINKIIEEKKRRELIIHTRSTLLQGLLTSESKELWSQAHISRPEAIIKWLECQTEINNKKSIAGLCLSFVMSCDWVDGVVVGMESYEQLLENIEIFSKKKLLQSAIILALESRPFADERTLNPACWR